MKSAELKDRSQFGKYQPSPDKKIPPTRGVALTKYISQPYFLIHSGLSTEYGKSC